MLVFKNTRHFVFYAIITCSFWEIAERTTQIIINAIEYTLKKRSFFAALCDPAGARTQDPNIKSVVLYQLSYGISNGCFCITIPVLGVQK